MSRDDIYEYAWGRSMWRLEHILQQPSTLTECEKMWDRLMVCSDLPRGVFTWHLQHFQETKRMPNAGFFKALLAPTYYQTLSQLR